MKSDTGAQNYGDYKNPRNDQLLDQAQISLDDCLACRHAPPPAPLPPRPLTLTLTPHHSGCITSAESVLITLQSHTEVLRVLAENQSNQ